MTSLILLLALAFPGAQQDRVPSPPLWGRLESGGRAVGLRVVQVRGPSIRRAGGGASSTEGTLEVLAWYPAIYEIDDTRMAFEDYIRILPDVGDDAPRKTLRDWLARAVSPTPQAVDDGTLDRILAVPTAATRDAPRRPGRFPLVLWTVRDDTEVAQSVLSEFLASHGYVVAVVRRTSDRVPPPWELQSDAAKEAAFATHLADLEFALAWLQRETFIDASRVAVVTWSYAAELASQLQVDHAEIRLVVGLSSNPLSAQGVYSKTNRAYDAARLTAHYVLMTERVGPNGEVREAPPLLRRLPAGAHFVSFPRLAHGSFNLLEGMIPGLFDIQEVHPWSIAGDVAQLGYETIARATRHYLDGALGDSGITRGSSAWADGLPRGFVTITPFESDAR